MLFWTKAEYREVCGRYDGQACFGITPLKCLSLLVRVFGRGTAGPIPADFDFGGRDGEISKSYHGSTARTSLLHAKDEEKQTAPLKCPTSSVTR